MRNCVEEAQVLVFRESGTTNKRDAGIANMTPVVAPPFTEASALQKVEMAEDPWNTRDPDLVVLAYTEDSQCRNRAEFLKGREEIRAFLRKAAVGRDRPTS